MILNCPVKSQDILREEEILQKYETYCRRAYSNKHLIKYLEIMEWQGNVELAIDVMLNCILYILHSITNQLHEKQDHYDVHWTSDTGVPEPRI